MFICDVLKVFCHALYVSHIALESFKVRNTAFSKIVTLPADL